MPNAGAAHGYEVKLYGLLVKVKMSVFDKNLSL
jgi:hypothetical protein